MTTETLPDPSTLPDVEVIFDSLVQELDLALGKLQDMATQGEYVKKAAVFDMLLDFRSSLAGVKFDELRDRN